MKSRPIQYLGLAALLLVSLAVIFLPIAARPDAQSFDVPLVAPKPFQQLIGSTQVVADVADAAFVAAYKNATLPGTLTVGTDSKTATVQDQASTQAEARERANLIVKALEPKFKGIKLAPSFDQELQKLPAKPLFPISSTLAVYPPKTEDGSPVPAVKLGLDLQGGVNLVLQVRRALFTYDVTGAPTDPTQREALLAQVRTALGQTDTSVGLRGADTSFTVGGGNVLEVRTQATD
ncbi:hypothetical protein EON80_05535, partial [bacterium]